MSERENVWYFEKKNLEWHLFLLLALNQFFSTFIAGNEATQKKQTMAY